MRRRLGPHRLPDRRGGTRSDRGHQSCGHSCRDEGGDVIEAGTRPPVAEVSIAAVPHHRVHRVDGAVSEGAGRAGHCGPPRRRHHRVHGVLGHRFDHGPGHALDVEARHVAPDQARQELPGAVRDRRASSASPIDAATSRNCLPATARYVAARRGADDRSRHHAQRRSRGPHSRRPRRGCLGTSGDSTFSMQSPKSRTGCSPDGGSPMTRSATTPRAAARALDDAHHLAARTRSPTVSPTTPAAPSTSPVKPPIRPVREGDDEPRTRRPRRPPRRGRGCPDRRSPSPTARPTPIRPGTTAPLTPPRGGPARPARRRRRRWRGHRVARRARDRATTAMPVRDAHHSAPRTSGAATVDANAPKRSTSTTTRVTAPNAPTAGSAMTSSRRGRRHGRQQAVGGVGEPVEMEIPRQRGVASERHSGRDHRRPRPARQPPQRRRRRARWPHPPRGTSPACPSTGRRHPRTASGRPRPCASASPGRIEVERATRHDRSAHRRPGRPPPG